MSPILNNQSSISRPSMLSSTTVPSRCPPSTGLPFRPTIEVPEDAETSGRNNRRAREGGGTTRRPSAADDFDSHTNSFRLLLTWRGAARPRLCNRTAERSYRRCCGGGDRSSVSQIHDERRVE